MTFLQGYPLKTFFTIFSENTENVTADDLHENLPLSWSRRPSEVIYFIVARSTNSKIVLKCFQFNYWSHYLSFDMSFDMGEEKVVVMFTEVTFSVIARSTDLQID